MPETPDVGPKRLPDPTYVAADITANPIWALAFRLSEFDNDNAPIGWSRYIPMARWLIGNFNMEPRADA